MALPGLPRSTLTLKPVGEEEDEDRLEEPGELRANTPFGAQVLAASGRPGQAPHVGGIPLKEWIRRKNSGELDAGGGTLADFREQYPQYADLDDEQLGAALHQTYYADVEEGEFRTLIGLPPKPEPPGPPSLRERVNVALRQAGKKVRDVFAEEDPALDYERFVIEGDEPDPRPLLGADSPGFGAIRAKPAAPESEARPPLLRDQFFAGWDQYRANRAASGAMRTVEELAHAPAVARGERQPEPLEGHIGGFLAQRSAALRAERARAGDPQAIRDIEAEVSNHREAAAGTLQEMIDRHAALAERAATVPFSEASQAVLAAETFGAGAAAVLDDPVRVVAEISIRSAPNMAEAIPLAIAGSVAGPWGFAGGLGAGSAMTEYRASFAEALTREGVDLTDARSMLAAAEDPVLMSRVRAYASTRAGAIGAFDFLSGGFASKTLTPWVKNAFGRELTNLGAQTVLQSATGAAGEATAQLLTEGELAPGEILAEALGEGGTAPIDVGAATVSGVRAQRLQARQAQIEAELNEFLGGDVPRETTAEPEGAPEIPPSPTPEPEPAPEPAPEPTDREAPAPAPPEEPEAPDEPGREYPQPKNDRGVYDDREAETFTWASDKKKRPAGHAAVRALEIGPGEWISSVNFDFNVGNMTGHGQPLTSWDGKRIYSSREQAIAERFRDLVRHMQNVARDPHASQVQHKGAADAISWANERLVELGQQPEPLEDPAPPRYTEAGDLRIITDTDRDTDAASETFEDLDGIRLGDQVKLGRKKVPGEVRQIFIVDGRRRARIFVPESTPEYPEGYETHRDLGQLTVVDPILDDEARGALDAHPGYLERLKQARAGMEALLARGEDVQLDERNDVMGEFRAAFLTAKNNLLALPERMRAELRREIEQLGDSDTLAAPEAKPEPPSASAWFDVRLKRAGFRASLTSMAGDLTPNGGVTYITDEHERIVGRTPSVNPDWFKTMNETPETRMSVRRVQKAVEKAVTGQPLGVREQRVIQGMLDTITGEREDQVDFAREQLEQARDMRRAARGRAGLPVDDPDLDAAGEIFDEEEYDGDMSAPARVIFELMEEANREGVPEADLERLAIQYDDNAALIEALERRIHEQRHQAGTEAVPPQPQARPEPAPEGDLLGDDTRRAQELADEIRRRDEARNRGQEEVETGDPGDLFSEARRQQDLEDVTRAKPPPSGIETEVVVEGEKGTQRQRKDKRVKKYLSAKRPPESDPERIISYRTEATLGYNMAVEAEADPDVIEFLRAEALWAGRWLEQNYPDTGGPPRKKLTAIQEAALKVAQGLPQPFTGEQFLGQEITGSGKKGTAGQAVKKGAVSVNTITQLEAKGYLEILARPPGVTDWTMRVIPDDQVGEVPPAYNDQQFREDLDGYLNEEPVEPQQGAPDLEVAKRAATKAVADLGSAPGVFAETASRELARRRSTDLIGQTLRSTEDLAVAAQLYRDPRFETLRFIFTDDNGQVVAQLGVSTRLPASAPGFIGFEPKPFFDELQLRAQTEGATGYFMLHNHPTGTSTPSNADERLTQLVARQGLVGLTYRGHVVVNHNEYSEIFLAAGDQARSETHQVRLTEQDFRQIGDTDPDYFGGLPYHAIAGPQSVYKIARDFELGADNEVSIIVTDNRHRVLGVHSLAPEAVKNQPRYLVRRRLLRAALSFRGARLFAVGRDLEALMPLAGMVVDAVHLSDEPAIADGTRMVSLRETRSEFVRSEEIFPATRMPRVSPDTSPAFDYLRPLARDIGRSEGVRRFAAPHEIELKQEAARREHERMRIDMLRRNREEREEARRLRAQAEREGEGGQQRLPGVEESRDRYGERRADPDRRARIANMSTEEIIQELYTDPLTGLANRRAFLEEHETFPWLASVDVDSLKFVNDNLSPDAGDAMLVAVGEALDQAGVDAYHISGDEFYVAGETKAEVEAAVELAKGILANQTVSSPRGRMHGIKVTYGIGQTKGAADSRLKVEKKRRAETGKRAGRGEAPSGFTLSVVKQTLDMEAGSNYVPIIGQSGALPIDANNRLVLGNGRKVRIPKKPIRREHVLTLMQRAFGNRIWQGRVKGKMRLGFYRPGHGEIRIKNANDIEVAGHELAHWLDDRFPWIERLYKNNRAIQEEIKSVSYDVEKVFEGYAEFMRLFFTQEWEARSRAPGFYDLWMKALNDHPKLRDSLFDIQELMHAWHQQGARARLASKHGTADASIFEKLRRVMPKNTFLQSALDGLRGLRMAELDISDGATTTAYEKLRIALGGSNGVLEALMFWGTPGFRADGQGLEFTGDGLRTTFGDLWGEEDMALYMIARRGEELMRQGRENLLRADEIEAGLKIAEARPEVEQVFERWQALNQRMLEFAEDSGILGADVRALIEEANKSYVPFHRVIESEIEGRGVKRDGNPFMRLTGGTRNVGIVWENILANYGLIIRMALVNDGKRSFYRLVESTQGSLRRNTSNQKAGLYAAPIGKDVKPVKIQSDQVLRKAVESMGWTMQQYTMAKEGFISSDEDVVVVDLIERMAAGLGQMVTFFKTGVDPTGTVDYYLDQGRSKFFEIGDPGLWDSIQFMGPKATNLVLNILGGFTSTLRRGVVAVPVFQTKNFMRDTVNAWLLSDHVKVPAARALKVAFSRMSRDPAYQQMLLNGGGFANRAQGLQAQRKLIIDPTRLTAIYDRFMGRFENANRLAEYQAGIAAGESPRRAALLSREISTDFAMRGSSQTARVLAIAVPFLNARAQGNYRVARQFTQRDRTISYAMRGAGLMTATLALYALNRDDDRYKELPEDVKDLYWVFFTGAGEDDYFLIPKPFESGMLWGTIPERLMEYSREQDGEELTDALLWMFLETFNMDMVPQAFSPWRDLMRNKNFADTPIVPFYLENVDPSEQYSYYTSESVRMLAEKMGISPLKAEHVIRGYLGTMGTYAIAASDALVRASIDLEYGEDPTRGETWRENVLVKALIDPLVTEGPPRRTKYVNDFYEMVREAEQVAKTAALMQKRHSEELVAYLEDPERAVQYATNPVLQSVRDEINELRRAMDLVRQDTTLTGDEKRSQIWELVRSRNALVQQAVTEIALAQRDEEERMRREQAEQVAVGAQ